MGADLALALALALRLSKPSLQITPPPRQARSDIKAPESSCPAALWPQGGRFRASSGHCTAVLGTKDPSRLRRKSTRHQGRLATKRETRPSWSIRNMAWLGKHSPVNVDRRLRFTTHVSVATNSRCRMRPPISRGCPQPANRAKRCTELHGNTDLSHKGIDMLERLQLYRPEHA